MKKLILKAIIRWILSGCLLYFVYPETGWATVTFAFLVFAYIELKDYNKEVME